MYSVVVMAALTSGAELPDGHRGGCGHTSSCGASSCGGGRHHGHMRHGHRHHGGGCDSCSSGCVAYAPCSTSCGTPYPTGYGAPAWGPGMQGMPAEPIKKMPAGEKKSAIDPAEATIVVSLPDDASLTVDGAATTSTSGVRVLVSPTLEPGRDFHYTLKAEVVRDGKAVRVEKRVAVRAGEETQVSLDLPVAAVALR